MVLVSSGGVEPEHVIGRSILLSHFLRMRQQQAAQLHRARRMPTQPMQIATLTYPF